MNIQPLKLVLLFIALCTTQLTFAQKPTSKDDDSKHIIIKMRQQWEMGFGCCDITPYIVTLYDNGTIIYEGIDEPRYDPKQKKSVISKELPERLIVKRAITREQFSELLNEFYKAKFHAMQNSYQNLDVGNGMSIHVDDGGLATVFISLSVYGQTKTIENYYFAPKELIELQRKVYALSNIAKYITRPPYWLTKFPVYEYPELLNPNIYRKTGTNPPAKERNGRIDINKWGFLTPCVTPKAEVKNLMSGASLLDDKENSQRYQLGGETIHVSFVTGKKGYYKVCDDKPEAVGTVEQVSVNELDNLYLSDLKIDLSKFKSDLFELTERSYYSEQEGISFHTRIVEFSDRSYGEKVMYIYYVKNYKSKRNDAK